MLERRRYKNPPIEEAFCEFRFRPGQDWDLTIPGRLQVELGDEYPGKPRESRFAEIGLRTHGGQSSDVKFPEGLFRIQLTTTDSTRMVGVGPDVLSIHMLRPYQNSERPDGGGWEEFRLRIEEALRAYWRVTKPEGINRVGIRYINKIVIPQEQVRIEDYLNSALPEPSGLPDQLTEFMSRVDYQYDNEFHIVLSQATIEAGDNRLAFLLDIDAIWENPQVVGTEKALALTNDLRDRERVAFEAVITEKTRELFDDN